MSNLSVPLSLLGQYGAVNPSEEAVLYSDFVADVSPFGAVTGTTSAPSSSTITFSDDSSNGIVGSANITVNGTVGSRGGIFCCPSSTTTVNRSIFTPGETDFKTRINFSIQAGSNQRVAVGLGLTHSPAGSTMLQYGAAFVAYGNLGNWKAAVASDNVVDEVDTGVPAQGWATLGIKINSESNEFQFYANGNLIRTVTGTPWDMVSTSTQWGIDCRDKNAGGTGGNMIVLVDYMVIKRKVSR